MNLALILVPYDTARQGWRSGAGPGHLLHSGLAGPANAHPAPAGLSLPQLLEAITTIRAGIPLGGVTVASYAPEYDVDGRVREAAFAALAASVGA